MVLYFKIVPRQGWWCSIIDFLKLNLNVTFITNYNNLNNSLINDNDTLHLDIPEGVNLTNLYFFETEISLSKHGTYID